MSSNRIKVLLSPPSREQSNFKAKEALNSKFYSVDDLEELKEFVVQSQQRHDELSKNVRVFIYNRPHTLSNAV